MSKKDFTVVGPDGKETGTIPATYEPEMLKNNPTKQAFDSAVEGIKGLGKRLKDNVMGTEEQNKAAQERMDKAKGKKAGGVIRSSASKRADGIAIRGKTRA